MTLLSLTAVRSAFGMALLLFPAPAARAGAGPPPSPLARRTIRVLGARQLAQGLAMPAHPSGTVLALGAGVDAAHAASMMALCVLSRKWRRAALVDAVIASCLASAGLAAAITRSPG